MDNNAELKLPEEFTKKDNLGFTYMAVDLSVNLNKEACDIFGFKHLYVNFVSAKNNKPHISYDDKTYTIDDFDTKITSENMLQKLFKSVIGHISKNCDDLEAARMLVDQDYHNLAFRVVYNAVLQCVALKGILDNIDYNDIITPGLEFKREWIKCFFITTHQDLNPEGIEYVKGAEKSVIINGVLPTIFNKEEEE